MGVSWGLVADPLMRINWTTFALFLIYITAALFGVMNVVTAIFVESAMNS